MAQLTKAFMVVGLNQQIKMLDKLLASDPDMEKAIQKIIREVLLKARGELAADARSGLQMDSDPRDAYRAIRTTVYRQLLGGNVNILRKRKAGDPRDMWLPSGHTGRGGNRRPRSGRTKRLQSYWGYDRGFVLRFLNQGTDDRAIKYLETNKSGKTRWVSNASIYGNRGRIKPRNWFGQASLRVLEDEIGVLTSRIEELISEQFNS